MRIRDSQRGDDPCARRLVAARSTDYTWNYCMDLTLPRDYSAIERILTHRYPFLLVDRITEFEPDKRIVGIKNVTLNERYLARSGDEPPVLPPTILTEAVAQVGAIMILAKPQNREKLIFFIGIDRVRYRRPVPPVDVGDAQAAAQPDGTTARSGARRRQGRSRWHDDVRARPSQRCRGGNGITNSYSVTPPSGRRQERPGWSGRSPRPPEPALPRQRCAR